MNIADFQTRKAKPTRCLHCHALLDRATGESQPQPGDLSVCITCGNLMIFTEDMSLREPTAQELRAVMANEEIADLINSVRSFIREQARLN